MNKQLKVWLMCVGVAAIANTIGWGVLLRGTSDALAPFQKDNIDPVATYGQTYENVKKNYDDMRTFKGWIKTVPTFLKLRYGK